MKLSISIQWQFLYRLFLLLPLQEALKFVRQYGCEKVRLLELDKNRGKGGAVRMVGASLAYTMLNGAPPLCRDV